MCLQVSFEDRPSTNKASNPTRQRAIPTGACRALDSLNRRQVAWSTQRRFIERISMRVRALRRDQAFDALYAVYSTTNDHYIAAYKSSLLLKTFVAFSTLHAKPAWDRKSPREELATDLGQRHLRCASAFQRHPSSQVLKGDARDHRNAVRASREHIPGALQSYSANCHQRFVC